MLFDLVCLLRKTKDISMTSKDFYISILKGRNTKH